MAQHFTEEYDDVDYALPEADDLARGDGRGLGRVGGTGPVLEPVSEPPAWHRYAIAGTCLVLALISFFVLGEWLSSPDAHTSTIASLDKKKDNVTALAAGSTATSVGITAIPDDIGTPIAEQLADLGHDFLIVLAAIYLEKYLLTILSWVSFKILIPLGLLMFGGTVLFGRERGPNPTVINVSARFIIFGLFASMVVPTSVFISDMIENTYHESIEATMRAAGQDFGTAAQTSADATSSASTAAATSGTNVEVTSTSTSTSVSTTTSSTSSAATTTEEPFDFFKWLSETFAGAGEALSDIPGTAQDLLDKARNVLSGMVEAFAVMVVTSCLIPILVLFLFLWAAKLIMGINVSWSMMPLRFRTLDRVRERGARSTTLTRR